MSRLTKITHIMPMSERPRRTAATRAARQEPAGMNDTTGRPYVRRTAHSRDGVGWWWWSAPLTGEPVVLQ